MKKIALFCAVAAVAIAATAGDGLKFKFGSTGDTYADGTAVQDGEVYALVWSADGAFAGFKADGTLVDANANALIATSVAKNGGCVTTVFVADEDRQGGVYQIYLLDTRVTKEVDGAAVTAPAGLTDGALTVVNGAIAANDVSLTVASAEKVTVDGEAAGMTAAAIDWENVAAPTVTSVKLDAGAVVLEVANTVPYVQYTVAGGATPSTIDGAKPLATFLNGSAGGTITLKVAAPGENRFFKVTTK